MRKLNNFKSQNNNRIIAISAAIITFFMTHPICAQAQVLSPANKALTALQKDLIDHIIPVAAAVILLC
ncbi:TrbC/VirB2 family protein [Bartonella sp. AA33NXGY]|uniref:TrbC/VirB2 family protein n=1 Tax=Bartonella sp. AA33NXGY TaxID=3243433 RepID=UPI0035D019D0